MSVSFDLLDAPQEFVMLLLAGQEAASQGDKTKAHNLYRQAIMVDPYWEQVWLSLAEVVETEEDRRVCLENALELNPANSVVRRELRRLEAAALEDAGRTSPPRLARLKQYVVSNSVLILNAGSMVGTTLVTSGLGFAYWWLAARLFPASAVGLASAAVSAMMLIGVISMMGLGTLLIGELPRRPGQRISLIITALTVSGLAAGVLGFAFAAIAPVISDELDPIAHDFGTMVLFAFGVMLTATSLVLDQAMIGLLQGELQLWRNTMFATIKLVALWGVGLLVADELGMTIYATWALGNGISLVILAVIVVWQRRKHILYRPKLQHIRSLGRAALGHHALNLSLQAPGYTLPVIVTALLSASINASFYIAWMIATFAFIIPSHLTTVLYAVSASDPETLAHKARTTLRLGLGVGAVACIGLIVVSGFVLGFFGEHYANEAAWCLRVLGIGVLPLVIKHHYVAIRRVRNEAGRAASIMVFGSLLEVTLAAIGASQGDLTGLAVGWLIAVSLEALYMVPEVYRVVTLKSARAG